MFSFIKKGKEFNKIAMIMNQSYLVLTDIQSRLNIGDIKDDDRETLVSTAFVMTRGVDERIEKYDWDIESKIIIPSINSGYIPLSQGYILIMKKMVEVSQLLGMNEVLQSIIQKGDAYYEVERELPDEFLNSL